MDHDQPFRIALIVFFLTVLPIGLYHRIKSQATGEPLDRRQEGTFILVTLRPLAAALWLGVFAATGLGVFTLLVLRTRTEEANLVARFGDSYRAYMQRAGRFLPRIGLHP